jgi:hypothetical protein
MELSNGNGEGGAENGHARIGGPGVPVAPRGLRFAARAWATLEAAARLLGVPEAEVPRPGCDDDVFESFLRRVKLLAAGPFAEAMRSLSSPPPDPRPAASAPEPGPPRPVRERLPMTRQSVTHRFEVGGQEGYLTVGAYPDGRPGEVFLVVSKQGSLVRGFADLAAVMLSVALQHGAPLETLVAHWEHVGFEPAGPTRDPLIPWAASVPDYVGRWLRLAYLRPADAGPVRDVPGPAAADPVAAAPAATGTPPPPTVAGWADPPTPSPTARSGDACPTCGRLMRQTGTCKTCEYCGTNTGCG